MGVKLLIKDLQWFAHTHEDNVANFGNGIGVHQLLDDLSCCQISDNAQGTCRTEPTNKQSLVRCKDN
jgi:hypothetical protein